VITKVVKIHQDRVNRNHTTDIEDASLISDYLHKEIFFVGGIVKGLERICDEYGHSSEYEAGGVLQLAYVHLDRLSKMRDLLEEEKRGAP
jgi:hypothetical protein